jgi:hypothetical protein
MKLRKPHVGWLVFLVLLVVLGVRLAVVASRTETGWATVGEACRHGTVVFRRRPLIEGGRTDRARFLAAETDRILAANPDSAEMAMGAAWLETYLSVPRSRELAELATRLEPENVAWWRMCAILSFHDYRYRPVEVEWLEFLDECARHDPQNALYDYMAAVRLYRAAVSYDKGKPVEDADLMEKADRRFAAAGKKDFLAMGQAAMKARTAVLRESSLPPAELADLAARPDLLYWKKKILWSIPRYRPEPQDVGNRAEANRLARYLRDCVRLADQWEMDGESMYLRQSEFPPTNAPTRPTLAALDPDVMSQEEADRIAARMATWYADSSVHEAAFAEIGRPEQFFGKPQWVVFPFFLRLALRLAMLLLIAGLASWAAAKWILRKQPKPERLGTVRHWVAWIGAYAATFAIFGTGPIALAWAVVIVAWPIGVLLMFRLYGLTVRLFRRWGEHPDRVPAISTIWFVMLWQALIGFMCMVGVYFMAWGIECYRTVPGFRMSVLIVSPVLVMAALLAYIFFVRGYRKRTGRSPVPHIAAACILVPATFAIAAPWVVCAAYLRGLGRWPGPPGWADSRWMVSWVYLAQEWWSDGRVWHVAFCWWVFCLGAYASVMLALIAVAIWYEVRHAKSPGQRCGRNWFTRLLWRCPALLDCLGRSAIGAAGVFLLIALLIGPAAIRAVDRNCQFKMTYAATPEEHWAKVRAIVPRITQQQKEEIEGMESELNEAEKKFDPLETW